MVKLYVPDMHCGHCVSRIEKALADAGLAGTVALEQQTVTVAEADEQAVRALLDDLGFEVEA